MSLEKRLCKTFDEVAVSITYTSLTATFPFIIGIFSDIPAVKIFCTFAGGYLTLMNIFHKKNTSILLKSIKALIQYNPINW